MRVVMFCHSLLSDWNHGNAHFLRGIVAELQARGHQVSVYEPENAWSMTNLLADAGPGAVAGFHLAYPTLVSTRFKPARLDLDVALDGADLVLVHEWNDTSLVERIGRHRASGGRYTLLFHDTHHRSVTDVAALESYDLQHYDGVLAFGDVIRQRYVTRGWARRAWTWHEAADTRIFHPLDSSDRDGDLVWIGNWGDGERADELREFLFDPIRDLQLRARIYGVRYPDAARRTLADIGADYGGWLPNYAAPRVYSRFGVTVHVPRRPYVKALPGIPTIRVFEALACGIPLVSAWWDDTEHLFTPGKDFLMVRTGADMTRALRDILHDRSLAAELMAHGLQTIRARHTCAHRVDELFEIVAELDAAPMRKAKTA